MSVRVIVGSPTATPGVVFFKQKTAYGMRISDWSSDVCSSGLLHDLRRLEADAQVEPALRALADVAERQHQHQQHEPHRVAPRQIGRASCRERVCQYV